MSERRVNGALAGAALLLVALALGGCSTSISDVSLDSASSEPRAKDSGAYLPVNQLPPARDEAAMDPIERAKVQKELVAARDRQALATAAKDQGQSKDPSKDPSKDQSQNAAQAATQAAK
jgi:hypothetical protein